MSNLKIIKLQDSETVNFAAEELKKYLEIMDNKLSVLIESSKTFLPLDEDHIYLGTIDQFGLDEPKVDNSEFDDGIYVDFNSNKGIIAGTNPRSVLLGVYRFLREAGCKWIRPGSDGEIIPKRDLADINIKILERPSYRHRGICIEGAVSYDNVADIIDWAPKVGFNSYFIQFREAYTFFDRWYSHINNPLKEKEHFSIDMARDFVQRLAKEIKKRDLLYHAVGHGWTCEPFGIPGLGWDVYTGDIPESYIQYTAEVNGKRGLWEGIPLNTNLCYSNPKVRDIITDSIVEYLEGHPEIDVLHFWLADGSNNQCECEECRKLLPSDFYIMMLNELDRKLTLRGIDAKIVFLLYVDLLWPPERERIENPDRFIMMFAPITRSYTSSFSSIDTSIGIPEYKRNKLSFSKNIEENLAFLREWQKIFNGDSFDFDYHLMWSHYVDFGYMYISKIIYEDIRNLKGIGLNGLISCQVQRVFLPTGLPMFVMSQTLWDDKVSFEKISEEYFSDAFGPDGKLVREYLENLSKLFPIILSMRERPLSSESISDLSRAKEIVESFDSVIRRNISSAIGPIAKSWLYIKYHRETISKLLSILERISNNEYNLALEEWQKLKYFLQKEEDVLQSVFDLFEFISVFERAFNVS